jgi:hypothetical protein
MPHYCPLEDNYSVIFTALRQRNTHAKMYARPVSINGTLTFGHDGIETPIANLFDEDEVILILDDGRHGRILLTSSRFTTGRRSSAGIEFEGSGALSQDIQ